MEDNAYYNDDEQLIHLYSESYSENPSLYQPDESIVFEWPDEIGSVITPAEGDEGKSKSSIADQNTHSTAKVKNSQDELSNSGNNSRSLWERLLGIATPGYYPSSGVAAPYNPLRNILPWKTKTAAPSGNANYYTDSDNMTNWIKTIGIIGLVVFGLMLITTKR